MTASEKKIWAKWHKKNPSPKLSAEDTLVWLDGYRQLMFEIWKKNPSLKRRFEKLAYLTP